MLPEQFVIIGVVFGFSATVFYLIGVVKGTVQPNRVTYFLWALAPLIAFAAQLSQGVGMQSLLSFSLGFGALLIFAASFLHKGKKHIWKLGRLDYLCGTLSLVGLLLWQITQVGNIAILFSIIADLFAAIPTIVKSYKAPETESNIAYAFSGLAGVFTFLTITQWNFATYGFPVYTILINLIIYIILVCKLGKRLSR